MQHIDLVYVIVYWLDKELTHMVLSKKFILSLVTRINVL